MSRAASSTEANGISSPDSLILTNNRYLGEYARIAVPNVRFTCPKCVPPFPGDAFPVRGKSQFWLPGTQFFEFPPAALRWALPALPARTKNGRLDAHGGPAFLLFRSPLIIGSFRADRYNIDKRVRKRQKITRAEERSRLAGDERQSGKKFETRNTLAPSALARGPSGLPAASQTSAGQTGHQLCRQKGRDICPRMLLASLP